MSENELLYKGYVIVATPALRHDVWETSGHIQKAGDPLAPRIFFLASDTFFTKEGAIKAAINEGKQIIDREFEGLE